MGDLKLLDFLKLNINVILQLVGFYFSFLTVNAKEAIKIDATDFLSIKAVEYLGWPFLLFIVIYTLGQSFVHLVLINFADWVVKKRLKGQTYEEIMDSLESYGKFMVSLTKMNEQVIGHQISRVIIATYNYSVFITLLVLHLCILLNNTGMWWIFIGTLLVTFLLHFAIFLFRHVHTLKLAAEANETNSVRTPK